MLAAIIDWSGRNRFLVLLATLFVTIAGIHAVLRTPIDALPDLSDVQVIVYTEYPGQAPQVVEDQVTYPLTTAMLSVPRSRVVRGKGYLRGRSDIERLVVKSDKGTPVLIRDIARVELAPDERRGLTELNGEGEVVSGIAMARYGQNALEVIHNLKAKIAEIGPGLPAGVTVETVYDRSELIHRAIETLKRTLLEESFIVALVCIVSCCTCAARWSPS